MSTVETSGKIWYADQANKSYTRNVFSGKEMRIGGMCELDGGPGISLTTMQAWLVPSNSLYFAARLSHYTDTNNKEMLGWILDPMTGKMKTGFNPHTDCYRLFGHGARMMVLGWSTGQEAGTYGQTIGGLAQVGCQLRLLIDGEYDCHVELNVLVFHGYSLEGLT